MNEAEDLRERALRDRFDSLPNRHVFSVEDVDTVPAVLGRRVPWGWSARAGKLLSLEAYDKKISTAGDLRRLLKRTDKRMSLVRAVVNPIIESTVRDLAKVLDPMRREITDARICVRVLLEMLEERDAGFYVEFAKRFREGVERDAPALFDQTFAFELDAYEAKYADWLAGEEKRLRAMLGDDAYEQSEPNTKAWFDEMMRRNAEAAARRNRK